MGNYLSLSREQIIQLEQQACTSEDWTKVLISKDTDINQLRAVHFSGEVLLGAIYGETKSFGGVVRKNGIFNTHLHNCQIGDRPFIKDVRNYIANYDLGSDVVIEGVDIIATEGISSFGNGVVVEPLNEGGGRAFPIYDTLSAQIAYVLSVYRYKAILIDKLIKMIELYAETKKSSRGHIEDSVQIINVRKIKNVRIGAYTKIDTASTLENGTIISYKEAPVLIGNGVMAKDFIISSDTLVDNSTLISKCFVGQGCVLDKHYSAENSVFFANSQGFNGEACSAFAGPFTVTHHKSTLLIAGMFSFMNAGSGSNQSNHMYKLGPVHQGILERGAKTTSDSYLLWPAKVGAFTLVMGRHYNNTDSSKFPFSYLIEEKGQSILVPAVNLRSVGTVRDAQKWPKRDRRHQAHRIDSVNFNLLSPYTIDKMYQGRCLLERIEELSGQAVKEYNYRGLKIYRNALLRGKKLYNLGIYKFLGNSLISRIHNKKIESLEDLQRVLKPNGNLGRGKWVDVSGLICPLNALEEILQQVEQGALSSLESLQVAFTDLHARYYDLEWEWVAELFEELYGYKVEELTIEAFIDLVVEWREAVVSLDELLYEDAGKEFSLARKVGFGQDGSELERNLDFVSVRGAFDSNSTVLEIKEHIKRKSELGARVIQELQKLLPQA